ncbi:hypothetical protein ACLSY0_10025 [Avibacterium avium]|uniref:hypothetical protein n=1 Tax=Avibacterium avium TaxID=751 RepID=UPI003BF92031
MNWRILSLMFTLLPSLAMAILNTFAEDLQKAELGNAMAKTIVGTAYHLGRKSSATEGEVKLDYAKAL